MSRLHQSLSLVTLVLAALSCVSCGHREPGTQAQTRPASLRPVGAAPHWQLLGRELAPNGMTLKLRWQGKPPEPGEASQAMLCLPPSTSVRARITQAARAGKLLPVNDTQTTTGTRAVPPGHVRAQGALCEFVGYVRRWPLFRLTISDDVIGLLRPQPAVPGSNSSPAVPAGDDLELTVKLEWAPVAATPTAGGAPANPAQQNWQHIAASLVLNTEDLAQFEQAAAPPPGQGHEQRTDPTLLAAGQQPWGRLRVTQPGLIRLTPELLLKAGFPANVPLTQIRVFSHQAPVRLLLVPGPGAPAGWEPGAYFWARVGETNYDAARVYWITCGEDFPAAALPVSDVATSAPRLIRQIRREATLDRDRHLQTRHGSFLAIEEMRWVDDPLQPSVPYGIGLQLPYFTDVHARLRAEAEFFIDREGSFSNLRAEVNAGGHKLAPITFSGERDTHKVFEVPGYAFQNGRTTLTLTLTDPDGQTAARDATQPRSPNEGGIFFDKIKLAYPGGPGLSDGRLRITPETLDLETTNPLVQPRAVVAGAVELAVADLQSTQSIPANGLLALQLDRQGEAVGIAPLRTTPDGQPAFAYDPVNGAQLEIIAPNMAANAEKLEPAQFEDITSGGQPVDMLLITHHEFLEQARRLAEWHEQQGIKVRIVDVQAIYDQFSHGELSPEAIRAYLGWTLRHWTPMPSAVLLLGDCSSDYKDVAHKGVRNWVPTYSYQSGSETWASDYWLTTVSGNDDLGDLMLGRLPVASREDARQIVDKIITYGSTPRPGPWRARLGYVSDDGEFPDVVESLRRDETPAALGAGKVFLSELPLEDNWYLPQTMVEAKRMKVSHTATEQIFDLFKTGVAFMEYYGHGSPNIWADERIWFGGNSPNSDNLHLADTGYMPLVANMTCNSGAIDYPLPPWNICITEDLLRVKNGGAIGCYVPSGPGVTQIHRQMSEALRWALFEVGARDLGQIVALTKLHYALERRPLELTYMYLLLSDPLLTLQMTRNIMEFELDSTGMAPGGRINVKLEKLPVAAGQFIAELVDLHCRTILSTPPAEFSGGKLKVSLVIPPDAPLGDARARIYAWNPQSGEDVAAAARFEIAKPNLTLDSVEVKPEAGRRMARAQITNPTALAAQGSLQFTLLTGDQPEKLERRAVQVAPHATTSIELQLPAAQAAAPQVLEARLELPQDSGSPGIARVQTQQTLAQLPAKFTGLVAGLSNVEQGAASNATVHLTAAANLSTSRTAPLDNLYAALQDEQGRGWSTQTLALDRRTTQANTQVHLQIDRALLARLRHGTAVLGQRGQQNKMLYEMPIAALPILRRQVRIVPGSVKARSDHAPVGATVFIDCVLENTGELPVENPALTLYDGSPLAGGRAITPRDEVGPLRLQRLAPGRTQPVTMRWDPMNNLGRKIIYLQLNASPGDALTSDATRLVPITIEGLSKAKLSIRRTWAEATPAEQTVNRIRLFAEVHNAGQTEARHVMVSFFRSAQQTPENKLSEVELDRIEGGKSVQATYTWRYESGKDIVRGGQLPKPTVQVWLKGSSQRLSSED
jgi:hypothetical protein